MNSKQRGDVGMGIAIAYFVTHGYTVCLPLTDSQDYDLIVDKEGHLQRVQVRTVTYKNKQGDWRVSLQVCGGNRSGTGKKKVFDPDRVDAVFVCAPNNEIFLVPACQITAKTCMSMGTERYSKFRVHNSDKWSHSSTAQSTRPITV